MLMFFVCYKTFVLRSELTALNKNYLLLLFIIYQVPGTVQAELYIKHSQGLSTGLYIKHSQGLSTGVRAEIPG